MRNEHFLSHLHKILIFVPTTLLTFAMPPPRIDEIADSNEPANIKFDSQNHFQSLSVATKFGVLSLLTYDLKQLSIEVT